MNPAKNVSDKKLGLIAVVLLCVAASGCRSSAPTSWNLSFTKRTSSTISLDLIAVSADDKQAWAGYPLEKYWAEGGDLRREQADKIEIKSDLLQKDKPYVIQRDNPKWQEWLRKGRTTELLLMPELHAKVEPDPRKFLPLAPKDWKATNHTLELEIKDTIITVETPRR
jgi:hypothetical protein